MAAGLADDDGKLAFVVEHVRRRGLDHGLVVADLGVGEADEKGRVVGWRAAGLFPVGLIVKPDTDDLVRIGDHRQIGDGVEAVIGGLALGGGLGLFNPATGDQGFEIGIFGADP